MPRGRKKKGEMSEVAKFRADVVASRQTLRSRAIKEKWVQLKKQARLCTNIPVEGYNPPQILFPEEIWLMIFEQLNGNSLRNCYNTCRLFRNYLGSNGNLILFRKALPIIFKHNYLNTENLLYCRPASKSMCHLIDNFFESRDAWRAPSHAALHEGSELVPTVHSAFHHHLGREVLNHSRSKNPFISRSVIVTLPGMFNFGNANIDQRGIASRLVTNANLLTVAQHDFQICGNHIWYLSLDSRTDISEKHVLLCLDHCPNLRRLEISDAKFVSSSAGATIAERISEYNLPHLSSLVLTLPKKSPENSSFTRLQNALVNKFSGQIRELKVTFWTEDYSKYDWSLLDTLSVERCGDTGSLESLCETKAKSVRKLSIGLHCENNADGELRLLLQVIHSFAKMEDLSLQFSDNWKISDSEILSVSPTQQRGVCSTSLKRIIVKTSCCDDITYSFLLYFPQLEHVHILYSNEYTVHLPFRIDGRVLQRMPFAHMLDYRKKVKRGEVLQIREYMYRHRGNMHRSPIWKVLPLLRDITLTAFGRSISDGRLAINTEEVHRRRN